MWPAKIAASGVAAQTAYNVASNVAKRFKRSFSNSAPSSEMSSGGIVSTFQKDFGRLYSKRRKFRSRRRRFRKRKLTRRRVARIVRAVVNRDIGTTRLNYTSIGVSNVSAGTQSVSHFTLAGLYGSADSALSGCGDQDLVHIRDVLTSNGMIGGAKAGKFKVLSAVMDVTLHNEGATSIECDVYKVWYKNTDSNFSSPATLITELSAMQSSTALGSTGAYNQLGWSLFSIPNIGNHCVVLNVERLYIGSGTCQTLLLRQKRPIFVSTDQLNAAESAGDFITKGTMGFILVYRGCPTFTDPNYTTEGGNFYWHVNRRYHVSCLAPQDERSVYTKTT